ncbi:MAG: sensor histidine kinase [Vicinamibacterales bacterium]
MAWRGTLLLIAVIGTLLPAMAYLQYHWLGDLSRLEQMRARTNLDAAAQRLSMEFDELLAAVYARYDAELAGAPPDLAGHGAAAVARYPRLVKDAWLVVRTDAGLTARPVDQEGPLAPPAAWPAWLREAARTAPPAASARQASGLDRSLLDEIPALVVRRGSSDASRIVVALDRPYILEHLLPDLLASTLEGGIPVVYDVLINREDEPDQVIYASRTGLRPGDFDGWVSLMPLFGLHSRDLPHDAAAGLMPDAAAHRWRVFIKPQDGTLEAAVGAARTRNLWIGASVLGLLGVSVGLLVFSVHRVRRAAQESLDLVARISHELRTPLSTITCAGENLADRVVVDAEETRYYGRVILAEGRRLHRTIADILLCCRLHVRADAALNRRPTRVADVIDRAIDDSQIVAAVPPGYVERDIAEALPDVLADPDALRAAIKNLIVNAIKHGERGPVRISARLDRSGEVAIEVEDHGPGIPAEELPRVFDPFYRGTRAHTREVDGSGIGLSVVHRVVRSHGGRVRVSAVQPTGTRFTVTMPVLPALSESPA